MSDMYQQSKGNIYNQRLSSRDIDETLLLVVNKFGKELQGTPVPGGKGEKGDKGDKGDVGPQGEQGPAGKDGKDGEVIVDEKKGFISVKDFGAVGDGTTDDTEAIQSALDEVNTLGGGTVYFPVGTFLISKNLTVYSSTTLQGASRNSTVVKQSSDNFGHISNNDVRFITINDMTFDGAGMDAAGGGGIGFGRTNNDNTEGIVMNNVTVSHCAGGGISINCPILSNFKSVTVIGCVGDAFSFYGSGTSVKMDSCYAITCTGVGFNFSQLNYSTISSCAVEVCGIGFWLHDNCNNVTLISTGAEDQIKRSDTLLGVDYQIEGGVGNTLMSVYSRNNVGGGINLIGASPVIMSYRQIGTAPYAIKGDDNSHPATVGNTVESGILLSDNGAVS